MNLEAFLQKHHQPSTVKIYLFEIRHYIKWIGTARAEQASAKDVLSYLSYLRKRYDRTGTIHLIIQAIKRYYTYLQVIEKREDHPCRLIKLRDFKKTGIQTQDLLTELELKALLRNRKERYKGYALRNKIIMSLLVNQALLTGEIAALKTNDIDLNKGTIFIHKASKTNERTLPLKAEQILLLHQYLNECRPQLIKTKTDALIITARGTADQGEGIHYLVSTFRKRIPYKKLTPTTIRQSVIALKLKQGQDLRVVQVFAGHRSPSSTEAYRSTNLEELKNAVEKYHPLK